MKKVILSLIAIATLSFTTGLYAGADNSSVVLEQQQEQKTEISTDDLPNVVKTGWAKSDYKSEHVEKIYKVKGQGGEYIEFIIKSDQGKKAIHFDLNGKFLKVKAVS